MTQVTVSGDDDRIVVEADADVTVEGHELKAGGRYAVPDSAEVRQAVMTGKLDKIRMKRENEL